MSDRILEKIRVIEMEGARCAFCGKLLADMGAEVIKIEPENGDVTRTIPPFLHDEEGVENMQGKRAWSLIGPAKEEKSSSH